MKAKSSRDNCQPGLGLVAEDDGVNLGDDGGESDEIVEDDEVLLGASEDIIRSRQKLNYVATISSLRLQPTDISRHHIPLCRMVAMPMVRPCLTSDLTKLEQDFVHGYGDGMVVSYVSTTNE